jgi:sirohydrochlorin cobaltochelatase
MVVAPASSSALLSPGPDGPIGVLICGHGSRNRLAVSEFAELAALVAQRLAPLPVEHGYLEFARPILRDGLERLQQQGVQHVLAVPAMPKTTSRRCSTPLPPKRGCGSITGVSWGST